MVWSWLVRGPWSVAWFWFVQLLLWWAAENPTKEVEFAKEVIFEKSELRQKVFEDVKRRNLYLRKYWLWFRPQIDIKGVVLDVHWLAIKVVFHLSLVQWTRRGQNRWDHTLQWSDRGDQAVLPSMPPHGFQTFPCLFSS